MGLCEDDSGLADRTTSRLEANPPPISTFPVGNSKVPPGFTGSRRFGPSDSAALRAWIAADSFVCQRGILGSPRLRGRPQELFGCPTSDGAVGFHAVELAGKSVDENDPPCSSCRKSPGHSQNSLAELLFCALGVPFSSRNQFGGGTREAMLLFKRSRSILTINSRPTFNLHGRKEERHLVDKLIERGVATTDGYHPIRVRAGQFGDESVSVGSLRTAFCTSTRQRYNPRITDHRLYIWQLPTIQSNNEASNQLSSGCDTEPC